MKTVNTAKEVKIVIPFIYDNEPGRIMVDFKGKLGIEFDGLEVKEAYYATMAEEIVVHATVKEDRYETLLNMYRKGEPVVRVVKTAVVNGRLEIINRAKWL